MVKGFVEGGETGLDELGADLTWLAHFLGLEIREVPRLPRDEG